MRFSYSAIANLDLKNQFDFKVCANIVNQEQITEENRNNKITAGQVKIALAKKTRIRPRSTISASNPKGKNITMLKNDARAGSFRKQHPKSLIYDEKDQKLSKLEDHAYAKNPMKGSRAKRRDNDFSKFKDAFYLPRHNEDGTDGCAKSFNEEIKSALVRG